MRLTVVDMLSTVVIYMFWTIVVDVLSTTVVQMPTLCTGLMRGVRGQVRHGANDDLPVFHDDCVQTAAHCVQRTRDQAVTTSDCHSQEVRIRQQPSLQDNVVVAGSLITSLTHCLTVGVTELGRRDPVTQMQHGNCDTITQGCDRKHGNSDTITDVPGVCDEPSSWSL